jgi:hypothetical protein
MDSPLIEDYTASCTKLSMEAQLEECDVSCTNLLMEAQLIEDHEVSCTKLSEIASSLTSYYCELDTRSRYLFVVIDKYKISIYVYFVLNIDGKDFFRINVANNIDGCKTEYDNIHDFSSSTEVIEFIKTYQPDGQLDNYSDDGWFVARTPDPDDCTTGLAPSELYIFSTEHPSVDIDDRSSRRTTPDLDEYYERPDSP